MAQTKPPVTFRVNPPATTSTPAPRLRSRRSFSRAVPLIASWLGLILIAEMLVLLFSPRPNVEPEAQAQVLALPATSGVTQQPLPTAAYRLIIPPLPPTVTPVPATPTPIPGQ